MDIELEPPHGITGFPLGMPAAELKAAAAALGRVTVQDEGRASQFSYMKVCALHPQFEIVFHLEDGRTLTAAEVWTPRPGPERITVRYRGLDVFGTPAREVLARLTASGERVTGSALYPTLPGLPLGFTRVAGHDVPLDPEDGEPLCFQAVLVAGTDYYPPETEA